MLIYATTPYNINMDTRTSIVNINLARYSPSLITLSYTCFHSFSVYREGAMPRSDQGKPAPGSAHRLLCGPPRGPLGRQLLGAHLSPA